ncbi:biliverdin-producing heme oxygenase [Novosphingobium huizhouense]|uniref:biliverdin-producing heme oxygenase n=1 Tax=Novosphingobium huizhouense TaxID=2866625 RepID=UPI001CD860B4|nr:biliverdin-producing heme oxygenase [Novosphingobium huizhouense]
MGEVRSWLRDATREAHARVDAAFAAFRLDDAASYRRFLTAHGQVLAPLERWLDAGALLPGWQGRARAVDADLRDFAAELPDPPSLGWQHDEAMRLGALYVLEGSRMGAAVLAREVPEAFPKRYLTARAAPGQWQALLALLDAKAADRGAHWRARALDGAQSVFALFQSAAQEAQAAYR